MTSDAIRLAVAKAICAAHGDDWNREGRRNELLPIYGPLADAAIAAVALSHPRPEQVEDEAVAWREMEPFSVYGMRAVSDEGKRWRIVSESGDWEMQPIGNVTAGQAEEICKGFIGLARERDRLLRDWAKEHAARPAPKPAADVPAGWRTMDSAPRDGTKFEARYEDGTTEEGVYWADERYCILGAPQGSKGPGCMSSDVGLPVEPVQWRLAAPTPPPTCNDPLQVERAATEKEGD